MSVSMSSSISSASPAASSAAMLRSDGLSVQIAGTRVLTDISFTVSAGQRVGLIGENGSGKSTLLHALHDSLPSSATMSGTVDTGTARVGLLHQAAPFSPQETLAEALESAVSAERRAARAVEDAAAALATSGQTQVVDSACGAAPSTSGASADAHTGDSSSPATGGSIESATAISATDRYSQALDLAERLDVWGTDARISATLAGLGLADIPPDRPTGELSGGQQARLSLAWLLLNRPDILLLDEPTNHLDDAAMSYLVGVLASWRGPVLFASHDRAFLDLTASTLVDLDPAPTQLGSAGGVTRYTGNYSDYLALRKDARARWEQQYRDEQAGLKRLRAGVRDNHQVGHANFMPRTESRIARKFYADRNAKVVSRRVNDSRSRLEKLEESQIRKPPTPLTFAGLTAAQGTGGAVRPVMRGLAAQGVSHGPVLVATGVAVAGRLGPVSLSLGGQEKLLVTGPNGSGKSTLLSVLAGVVAPDSGSVTGARSSLRAASSASAGATSGASATISGSSSGAAFGPRIGYLTQEVALPDPHHRGPQRTVDCAYRDLLGEELAQRVPLSTFGLLHPRDMHRPLAALSVGTQRRVALAVLLADPPEVLLLDEPDNHFSLPLVTALEEAIPDYPGAVIVASHDRWLREHWRGGRLEL